MVPAPRPRPAAFLLVILLVLTALRVGIAAAFPLADDEAHYWVWAQDLDWGYPDHPPMVAAMVRLTTALAGDTPLGVRLGPILFALGTSLLLYALGRRMFSEAVGIIAALVYQVIPIFAVGAAFASPDAPLAFFWMLTMALAWRALVGGHPLAWAGAGLALGAVVLSKYPAGILGLGLAGHMLASPVSRRWLRRPEPYLAAALAAAMVAPFIAWNAQHAWLTLERARGPVWIALGSPVLHAAVFAAAQLVYYGPLTWLLLVAALALSLLPRRRADPRAAFLLWTSLPLLLITWAASPQGLPKPHWHAPAFLGALLLAAALWLTVRFRRRWRQVGAAAVAVNAVLIVTVYTLPLWPGSALSGELHGWDQVAAALQAYARQTPSTPGILILTDRYQTASQLAYRFRGRYVVDTVHGDTVFGLRNNKQTFVDWNVIYVNDLAAGPGIPLHVMFRKVEVLSPIEVTYRDRVVRRFSVYRGFGLRGVRPPYLPRL